MRGISKERLQRAMRLAHQRAEAPLTDSPEKVWRGLSLATRNVLLEDVPKRVPSSEMAMPRSPDLFSPDELDQLIETMGEEFWPKLVGCRVDTYTGYVGEIRPFGTESYGVRVRLECGKCKGYPHAKRTRTVYLSGGPHRGALCYAYDRKGTFVADLRNQEYVCEAHRRKS